MNALMTELQSLVEYFYAEILMMNDFTRDSLTDYRKAVHVINEIYEIHAKEKPLPKCIYVKKRGRRYYIKKDSREIAIQFIFILHLIEIFQDDNSFVQLDWTERYLDELWEELLQIVDAPYNSHCFDCFNAILERHSLEFVKFQSLLLAFVRDLYLNKTVPGQDITALMTAAKPFFNTVIDSVLYPFYTETDGVFTLKDTDIRSRAGKALFLLGLHFTVRENRAQFICQEALYFSKEISSK